MTFTSPQRGISAAIAALVSALLIMPSGTAFADEQSTPHPTEIETQLTLPSETPVEEDHIVDEVALAPQPEPVVPVPTETSEPTESSVVVELSEDAEVFEDTVERPAATAADTMLVQGGTPLACTSGYVYSLHRAGHIHEINPNGERSSLATFGSGNNYNGLGVGPGGSLAYGLQQTGNGIRIFRWDGHGSTPVQVVTNYEHGLGGDMVAGAVDLKTGDYYFGGFETKAEQYHFRIWRYTPARNAVRYVGHAETGINTRQMSGVDGDIAFNAKGDLFFLTSDGNQAALGTITSEMLSGATGGQLPSFSTKVETLEDGPRGDVNGIAFDPDGSIYIGTSKNLYRYDPTTWQAIGNPRKLVNSADLAGCSSPSSIEVTKNIVGRHDESDQFTVALSSGHHTVASMTTQGAGTGLQPQRIGPIPALLGETYTVREALAVGSASVLPTDYETSWVCSDGDGWQDSGVGVEFDVAVTKPGQTVSCEITNAPISEAQLTLVKRFETDYGAEANVEDWTLTVTNRHGQILEFAHNETKNVEAGQYRIAERFGNDKVAPGAAGYELTDITCTTDGKNNPVTDGQVTLEQHTSTECVLTNKDRPGNVVWQKTDTGGRHLVGSKWELTGPDGFGDNGKVLVTDNGDHDLDKRDGFFKVEGLWWGEYQLEELTAPDGYQRLEEAISFEITGAERTHEFSKAFSNVAIPTLTLFTDFETQYGATQEPERWDLVATNGEQKLAFNHGETQRVEAGAYSLTATFGAHGQEAADAGYRLKEIVCSVDGGEPRALIGELIIQVDTSTECTLVHVDLPGAVEWQKTNAKGTPLADSEWLLSGPNGLDERAIVDNGKYDVDKTAGTIRVEGLHWGDYTLEETKAPTGFALMSDDAKFTITGAARDYTFDEPFINEPLQPGTLPLTGIFSGKWPLISAAGLALALLTGLAGTLRRRNPN